MFYSLDFKVPGTRYDVNCTVFVKQFSICMGRNSSLGVLLGLVDLYERLGAEREKQSYVIFFPSPGLPDASPLPEWPVPWSPLPEKQKKVCPIKSWWSPTLRRSCKVFYIGQGLCGLCTASSPHWVLPVLTSPSHCQAWPLLGAWHCSRDQCL